MIINDPFSMAMLVSYMMVSIDVLHVNFRHELSVDVPESLSPLAGHNVETLGLNIPGNWGTVEQISLGHLWSCIDIYIYIEIK